MIVCPRCAAALVPPSYHCDRCGFEPERRGGFVAWAPDLSDANDGFHAEDFGALAAVEAANFWFRARNDLIVWALRRHAPGLRSLLEIGCGTGFVLSGIAQAFPEARLVGTEIHAEGLRHAAARLPGAELMQMDGRALPYEGEFDVVAAFDVIEHITEDEDVLRNLHRAVRPGGICLLTVPQHMWLWSPVDEEACHKRRYSARELEGKARAAGFRVLRSTSFVSLLLPLMLASRLAARRHGKSGGTESLRLHPALNATLEAILRLEHLAIRGGLSLPAGGSRIAVLQKP